jgi:CTP synthase
VKEMLGLGIQPDILVCRSELAMPQAAKRKIALFCNIPEKNVISAYDVRNIYEVPLILKEQNISLIINDFFANDIAGVTDTADNPPKLEAWHKIIHNLRNYNNKVKIGVVGKYTSMIDCYKSLDEALLHAGLANNTKVDVRWIDSDTFKNENRQYYQDLEGIIVPGGFGQRGSRGKLKAIEYARENNIPFLGICLGMQLAVIDACQNLANMANATSSELVDEATLAEHVYVISMMKKWQDAQGQTQISATTNDMGGTMRLGSYPCQIMPNTLTAEIYNGATLINERHRHRYEVNLALCQNQLEKQGYVFSGISPDNTLPEIVENRNHRWFIGVQFHPELKSTPHKPHPLFVNFVKNSTKKI